MIWLRAMSGFTRVDASPSCALNGYCCEYCNCRIAEQGCHGSTQNTIRLEKQRQGSERHYGGNRFGD